MSLDHAILGFLNVESLTGYDLKTRCFDAVASHIWSADQAQIYRTLDRLEQQHLVGSKLHPQTDRPNRKVYSITRAGREALAAWIPSVSTPTPVRDPLLLRLFFADVATDDDITDLLCQNRALCQQRLDALRTRTAEWTRSAGIEPSRDQTLKRMALDGAIASERAAIDWLDDCIDLVREGLTSSSRAERGNESQRSLFGFPSLQGGSQ